MSSIFTNKEFQNYYQNLVDNPTEIDENESAIIETMKNQFDELKRSHNRVLVDPFTHKYWETRKGLQNFEKFTTLFVQNHHLKTSDALEFSRTLSEFSRLLDEGDLGDALHDQLDRIKSNLLASSIIDRIEGTETSAQVKNNLNILIKDQQERLKEANESFQKDSKRYSLIRKIGNVGMAVFLPVTIIAAVFAAPIAVIIGFIAFGSSLIARYIPGPEKQKMLIGSRTVDIELYTRLQTLTDHPKFEYFALKEGNQILLADSKTTPQAMRLFRTQLEEEEKVPKIVEANRII